MKTLITLIAALAAVSVFAQCADCGDKKAKAAEAQCHEEGTKPMSAKDAEYLKQAHAMLMASEGKQEECCKSTAAKPIAKGDPGCCNAPDAPKKFKVFVAGKGYAYFGCADSAKQGRSELMAKGAKVGKVQKVRAK